MSVPVIFTNVSYRVAGSSGYRGDLILIPGKIYYFPHTDVGSKRFLILFIILAVLVGPLLLLSVMYVVLVFLALFLVLIALLVPSLFRELAVETLSNIVKLFFRSDEHSDKQDDTEYQPVQQPIQDELSAIGRLFYPSILYSELWYALVLDVAFSASGDNRSLSRHSLPTPVRLAKHNVRKTTLSSKGVLTADTDFAMKNQFGVGASKSDSLRAALIDNGFVLFNA